MRIKRGHVIVFDKTECGFSSDSMGWGIVRSCSLYFFRLLCLLTVLTQTLLLALYSTCVCDSLTKCNKYNALVPWQTSIPYAVEHLILLCPTTIMQRIQL